MSEIKDLRVWINKAGQKINTAGLSLNQNSTGCVLSVYTPEKYEVGDVSFRRPDGRVSPKYHFVYQGYEVTEDDASVESGMYKWSFEIPYALTSFTIVGTSAKLDAGIAFYARKDDGRQISPTVATATIVVNKVANSFVLDDSYNGVDVENLWEAVSKNATQISVLDSDKADKSTIINGHDLSSSFVINSKEVPFESDTDSVSTYEKIGTLQTQANSNSSNITNIINGTTTVGKADLANKASADASGNIISSTYEKQSSHNADIAALQASDTALGTRIDSEAAARAVADDSIKSSILGEKNERQSDVTRLQGLIDTTNATQNVVDIVATKAALDAYDTSDLLINDKVEVLADETQDGADTIYSWDTSKWVLVGSKAAYYSKSESDARYVQLGGETGYITKAAADDTYETKTDSASKFAALPTTYETISSHNSSIAGLASTYETKTDHAADIAAISTTYEKIADHNNDIGRLLQLDFTGTLSGDTITFELTSSADEISLAENHTYEIDLHFQAAGALAASNKMVISYGAAKKAINLTNILNNTGTMTVGAMRQMEKYSSSTGWRWIFNAVYNTANNAYFFGIPSTVVRADIIAMSDEDLLTHIGNADLEDGQLVFINSVGNGNGFLIGHTYKMVLDKNANTMSATDVSAAQVRIQFADWSD